MCYAHPALTALYIRTVSTLTCCSRLLNESLHVIQGGGVVCAQVQGLCGTEAHQSCWPVHVHLSCSAERWPVPGPPFICSVDSTFEFV